MKASPFTVGQTIAVVVVIGLCILIGWFDNRHK